ncbi:hypothetical protein HDE_06072 [Halotydeus destructor]|nr:hypothetical protein HDE_06072 [Halotydeus destructor]
MPLIGILLTLCTACPETWTSVNDAKCIKLFRQPVNHPEAVRQCQSQGAELMTIADKAEWEVVDTLTGREEEIWTVDYNRRFFGNHGGWCHFFLGDRKEATCPVYIIDFGPVKLCEGYCTKEYSFACQKPFPTPAGTVETTGQPPEAALYLNLWQVWFDFV